MDRLVRLTSRSFLFQMPGVRLQQPTVDCNHLTVDKLL